MQPLAARAAISFDEDLDIVGRRSKLQTDDRDEVLQCIAYCIYIYLDTLYIINGGL